MIIRKLTLQNYRKFKEKEIVFNKGINIILGNNEAGKSTISQAILDAFYADPSTQSKVILSGIKTWNVEKSPRIELEFEHDKTLFLLVKDFGTHESILQNLDSRKKITNLEDINENIEDMLGLATREIYKNTAFISHNDISKIDTNKDFLTAIQNIATESSEEVSLQGVLNQINDELKKIRLGLDRHANIPGPIKAAKIRINDLEQEISEKSSLVEKVNQSVKIGNEATKELGDVKQRIEEIQELINNYQVFESATKKLKEIDEQIKHAEASIISYNEMESKKEILIGDLNVYSAFNKNDSEKAALDLTALVEARKAATNELGRINIVDYHELQHSSTGLWGRIIGMVLVIVIAGLSYILEKNLIMSGVIFLAGIIFVLVVSCLQKRTGSTSLKTQMDISKRSEDEYKFKVQNATDDIQKILDTFQCEDLGTFFTNKARFSLIQENIKQINSQMTGLLTNASINDIKSRQLDLFQEKKEIETNELTEKIKRSKISSQEYLSMSREIEKLNNRQKELEAELTTAKVRVDDAEVDSDYLVRLEEELERERNNLEHWSKKDNIYQLTYDAIKSALKDTAQTAGAIIEKEIAADLPKLTSNRYSKVRMNDDLSIEVYSDEKEAWLKPIGVLSSGTIDQIYFLTRIGFIKALAKKSGLPIICDDPFATFDDKRRAELRDIIRELSEKYQVLVFTLSSEYADWGSVIKLEK